MPEFLSLTPLDIVFFRGNRPFGEAGEHGEAILPPWPSVFSGALRSALLASRNVPMADFASGRYEQDPAIKEVLGTPSAPGAFRMTHSMMLCSRGPLIPLPLDCGVFGASDGDKVQRCTLLAKDQLVGTATKWPLPYLAVFRLAQRSKPEPRPWLTSEGLGAYLTGEPVLAQHVLPSKELWSTDRRLGIALSAATRTAQTGRLYTSEAVALRPGVSFLVGVAGLGPLRDTLPSSVRLGGDGRSARVDRVEPWKNTPPPWESALLSLRGSRRFTMVLATPGLFPDGWLPPGVRDGVLRFARVSARLVSVCSGKPEVVSGWDLARWAPKPAQRVVPTGSVYFFETDSALTNEQLDDLRVLLSDGLWPLIDTNDSLWQQRRAEGFNNVWFGRWPKEGGTHV